MLDINWDTYLGIPCYASKFRRNHAQVVEGLIGEVLIKMVLDGPWIPIV